MRPVHGGCWWALALAIVAPVVAAGPAAAETTIEVEAGYDNWFLTGQELPVRVRVSADRLVRGTLEVAVGSAENSIPVAMPVEVPGGSQKEFILTATAGMNQNPDVTARLRQGDRLLASGQTTARAAGDTELVGVLPGAARGRPLPGPTPLAVDAGTARFVAIGDAELTHAPASLGPLSTLAADVDDLGRLSPDARAGVLRWIEDGGRLLVDAARGQAVPGLPDTWQPGPRGRRAAGLGEVVATDGAIAAGRWPGLVEPSGRGVVSSRFQGDPSLAGSLASDAGLRTPELGWLVAFLVVYVVAVGPVMFVVVRRRGRPELAWVAVPLVALLFSTGSYVVGRDLRKATELVHASIVSDGPAGPRATTYVGVFSRSGETARVGFPAGWSSGAFPELGQVGPTPTLVTTTPEGPDARLPLDAGQFGMVHAHGPAPGARSLEIVAKGDGGRITGTVRNPTSFALDHVAVFAGSEGVLLGEVGPGEERPFALLNAVQNRPDGGPEFRVWGMMGPNPTGMRSTMGLWQAAHRAGGVNWRAPGVVVAAGFTSDFSPQVRVDGRTTTPKGRTIVVGRQHADIPADGPLELAARRDVVRDPFASRFGPGPRGGGSVVRFVLPEGADTSKLVIKSPFGNAELWQDGAWQPARCEGANCGPGGPGNFPPVVCAGDGPCPAGPPGVRGPVGPAFRVPAATVRDGVVYARVPGPASLDPGPGGGVVLGRSA